MRAGFESKTTRHSIMLEQDLYAATGLEDLNHLLDRESGLLTGQY
jgi:hypothetical protein